MLTLMAQLPLQRSVAWVIALLLSALTLWPHSAAAQQAVPLLTARVVDTAQILTAGEAGSIETQLARVEQERGSQIVVLLVNTVAPEDISSYANRVANTWKIGRKDVGDGVLIIIAKEERKLRMEVAKSLEGAIPDLAAKQIISNALAPALKAGQYAQGIEAAIDQLEQRIAAENLPAPSSASSDFNPQTFGFEWADLLIFLFFVVPLGGVVAKGIFGNKLGALVTGGAVGGIAFYITASMLIAGVALVAALLFTLISSFGRSSTGRRGQSRGSDGWSAGDAGGGWNSGGDGGGGFSSGGGGDFGGCGASGDF